MLVNTSPGLLLLVNVLVHTNCRSPQATGQVDIFTHDNLFMLLYLLQIAGLADRDI